MKAIINSRFYDFKNYREDSYILFDEKILKVGPMKEFNSIEKKHIDSIIDGSNCMLMPGLINGHTHIYSTFSRGMNLPFNPQSFRDILDQLWWKLDGVLDINDCYLSAIIYGADCIKNGVTTLIDHHASRGDILGTLEKLKKAICDDLGLRGLFCFETSDRFNIDQCIEENLNFSKIRNESCYGLFGMHASMSISDSTMEKVYNLKGDIPIHIHVAESLDDEIDAIDKYGKTVVERLRDYKLLGNNSILAHCVHINDMEAEILGNNNVFVALNPTSNMNNAVGLPDYNLLKRHNIPCIIGNDGLGANITREYLNLTYSMKNKYQSPLAFNFDDLLKIINTAYEYVSNQLGIKIGRLDEGYVADLVLVPYNPPTIISEENIFSHIFFGIFDNFAPSHVICKGSVVMDNYKIKLPFSNVYEESREVSRKIWNKLK